MAWLFYLLREPDTARGIGKGVLVSDGDRPSEKDGHVRFGHREQSGSPGTDRGVIEAGGNTAGRG